MSTRRVDLSCESVQGSLVRPLGVAISEGDMTMGGVRGRAFVAAATTKETSVGAFTGFN